MTTLFSYESSTNVRGLEANLPFFSLARIVGRGGQNMRLRRQLLLFLIFLIFDHCVRKRTTEHYKITDPPVERFGLLEVGNGQYGLEAGLGCA